MDLKKRHKANLMLAGAQVETQGPGAKSGPPWPFMRPS